MNTESSWPREVFWLTVDVLLILFLAAWLFGFRVNFTSSMPAGLYLLDSEPAQRSGLVTFCLPPDNPFSDLARERTYLQAGLCPSGRQPLLKKLAGVPGDLVEISEAGIVLNRRLLPGTKRPTHDSRGRSLPESLLNNGVIPDGLALVLSQEYDGGFDGRHFGLIPLSSLQRVKPILTFGDESPQPQGE